MNHAHLFHNAMIMQKPAGWSGDWLLWESACALEWGCCIIINAPFTCMSLTDNRRPWADMFRILEILEIAKQFLLVSLFRNIMRQPQGHVTFLYFVFRYCLHYFWSRGKEPLMRHSNFFRLSVPGVSLSGSLILATLSLSVILGKLLFLSKPQIPPSTKFE